MDFRIADTFATSQSRLTAWDKNADKTTAFDVRVNPGTTRHPVRPVSQMAHDAVNKAYAALQAPGPV
jgi:hypothetical protein